MSLTWPWPVVVLVVCSACQPKARSNTAIDDILAKVNEPATPTGTAPGPAIAPILATEPAVSLLHAPAEPTIEPPEAEQLPDNIGGLPEIASISSPSDPRCERIRSENERRLHALQKSAPDAWPAYRLAEIRQQLRRCLTAAKQAWGVSFSVPVGSEVLFEIVSYRDEAAIPWISACVLDGEVGPQDCKYRTPRRATNPDSEAVEVSELGAVFDYDGDGFEELIVGKQVPSYQGDFLWVEIWSAQNGRLELYAPTRGRTIAAIRDIDQDGRPDLVTRASVQVCREADARNASTGNVRVWDVCRGQNAPLLWQKSLPDGGFAPPERIPEAEVEKLREGAGKMWGRPTR